MKVGDLVRVSGRPECISEMAIIVAIREIFDYMEERSVTVYDFRDLDGHGFSVYQGWGDMEVVA